MGSNYGRGMTSERVARVRDLEGREEGQRYVYALVDGTSVGHIGTSQRPPHRVWNCHEALAMNQDPRGDMTRYMWSRPQCDWVRQRGARFELVVLDLLEPGTDVVAAKLLWQRNLDEAGMAVPEVHEVPGPVAGRHQGKISGRLKGRAKTEEHSESMSRGQRAKAARVAAAMGGSN